MCRLPSTNRDYWIPKIQRNKARDRQINRLLRNAGWKVIRIWEHQLTASPERCVRRIKRKLGVDQIWLG
jgi:DNA mismatch endonuclease (patch repair protein)